jgi:N-methylhydantoinase A/oxoprolinase/acetone carboxylase beta subunit
MADPRRMRRIEIDMGGTFTDGVLVEGRTSWTVSSAGESNPSPC